VGDFGDAGRGPGIDQAGIERLRHQTGLTRWTNATIAARPRIAATDPTVATPCAVLVPRSARSTNPCTSTISM